MRAFPHEFEALLSPEGREVLAGAHPAAGALRRESFFTATGLLEPTLLAGCAELLARAFTPLLVELVRPLPPPDSATQPNDDLLPKVGRMLAVPFTGVERYLAQGVAKEIGLMQLITSESFHRFAEVLAGAPLTPLDTAQIFCSRQGDYAGPHADHHPDQPGARGGYVDVHLTFTSPGVREQFIVYQRDGHLSAMAPIAQSGTVTAYRLPIWHYTTPLQASSADDRRWLVLGSFHFNAPAEGGE